MKRISVLNEENCIFTVAILAQGTHSGRCGNAGLLPSIGCFPQAGAAATQAYCQALAAFPGGGVRAPGGQERKVAKVHKNVIIVKVFWACWQA